MVGGYFGNAYLQRTKSVSNFEANENNKVITSPDLEKTAEEYSSIYNEYNLYTNNELGFSIKLPKYTSEGYFECQKNKNDCEKFRKYLITKQIEGTNKLGFYSKKDGVEKEYFDGYFGDAVKEPTLNFYNIKNQSDIEANIKQLFGQSCKVDKIISSKNGKYKTPVVSGSPETCRFIGGLVIVNINKTETKMLISNFNAGQNVMFPTDLRDTSNTERESYKFYDFEFSDNITIFE